MIRVYAQRKGSRCRLLVEGHAAYSTENDIVCAGVSALTGALIRYARLSPACGHLRCYAKRGEAFLSCRGGLGAGFDLVLQGLCAIAEQYPAHVRIEAREGC